VGGGEGGGGGGWEGFQSIAVARGRRCLPWGAVARDLVKEAGRGVERGARGERGLPLNFAAIYFLLAITDNNNNSNNNNSACAPVR